MMLDGITVLDFTELVPGPLATQLFADLGATVIKVERPTGDPLRTASPQVGTASAQFGALNRGKYSLAVDLKHAEGVDVLRRVAGTVDVVMESFRPGVAERLGIGYDDLKAGHQSLVYASLAGFAPDHPRPADAAHDINALALSGLAAATVRDTEGPHHPAALAADVSLAALTATTSLAAVLRARATGVGCRLQLSLLDAALWTSGLRLAVAGAGHQVRAGDHLTSGGHAGYGYYECADGAWIAVGALEPQLWRRLLEALDCPPDLAPRHSAAAVAEVFARRTRKEWLAVLEPLDLCASPVLDYQQVASDPPRPLASAPAVIDGDRVAAPRPAPDRPGADTLPVLRMAGVPDHDITKALRVGALHEGGTR